MAKATSNKNKPKPPTVAPAAPPVTDNKAVNNNTVHSGTSNPPEVEAPKAKSAEGKAKEMAHKLGVKKVWQNSKGEFFTAKDRANLSDKRENIQEFDFSE